jgi:hypothetical protein
MKHVPKPGEYLSIGHAEKLTASFAAQMTEEEALAILAGY